MQVVVEKPDVEIPRFTLDGGEELERRLAGLCRLARQQVENLLPRSKIEALVLGGGYGRGEGGVLVTESGEQPYNDLEFYLFLRGPRLFNSTRYQPVVDELGEHLSARAGLHVEFKVDSLPYLRRSPISMFSYDLVSAHRVIWGHREVFTGCEHHLDAASLPLCEGTRLLLNRGTGLLLASQLLGQPSFSAEDADFVKRNMAKAQLSLGDAFLAACGQYHFSAVERSERLKKCSRTERVRRIEEIRLEHEAGLRFKLHPYRSVADRETLAAELRETCALVLEVWLWLESRRLERHFPSVRAYAVCPRKKWPHSPAWRNWLLNCRVFGLRETPGREALRHPRERLLRTLPLLLWCPGSASDPELSRHFRRQLRPQTAGLRGTIEAYKRLWRSYG